MSSPSDARAALNRLIEKYSFENKDASLKSLGEYEHVSNTLNNLYKTVLDAILKLYKDKDREKLWTYFRDAADNLVEIQRVVKKKTARLYSAGFIGGSLTFSKDFSMFVSSSTRDINSCKYVPFDLLKEYLCRSSDPKKELIHSRIILNCRFKKRISDSANLHPAKLHDKNRSSANQLGLPAMNSDGVFSPFLTISQDKHLNHITSCAGFDMSLGTASCHCKRKSTYNHNSDADELSSNGQSICSNFSNMGPSITWSSSSSSDEGSCDDPNDDFDIAPAPAKRVRTSRASHT